MHDEDGFLSAIRQTPADDTARLVFADWLDEQDDPTCKAKADFIRLDLRMAALPEQSLHRARCLNRLQAFASFLGREWLAVVSNPKLEGCRAASEVGCPERWARLTPTENPRLRFCGSCRQPIRYCDSLEVARDHAALGNCGAVSLALARRVEDLTRPVPPALATEVERLQITSGLIERIRLSPESKCPIRSTPEDEPPEDAPPPPREPRRQSGRRRNRSIERENWEETE
jgi:uncharacterized protein (TIGR02996 family)